MADDMGAEQLKPGAHEQKVAERWLKSRGINPPEPVLPVEQPRREKKECAKREIDDVEDSVPCRSGHGDLRRSPPA